MSLPKMSEGLYQSLLRTQRALKKYHSFRNTNRPSKRSVKANGRGVGQVLRNSRLIPQVNINKHFYNHDKRL